MSGQSQHTDGSADAIAATAIITIVVFSLYLWLSGMPQ
ncbi:methionine synthase [Parahaliea mediterranea]|nr:methionine synthase [Parahaliea mediterranea]